MSLNAMKLTLAPILLALPGVLVAARLPLADGWYIQPSSDVAEKGDVLSTSGFRPAHWYPTKVPSTVVSALVANRVYADPYFGMNLRSIPGTSYPIGHNFSNVPTPPGSPFKGSWWYRTQFNVPADYKGKQLTLHFDGINFRANVWLNGRLIPDAKKVA